MWNENKWSEQVNYIHLFRCWPRNKRKQSIKQTEILRTSVLVLKLFLFVSCIRWCVGASLIFDCRIGWCAYLICLCNLQPLFYYLFSSSVPFCFIFSRLILRIMMFALLLLLLLLMITTMMNDIWGLMTDKSFDVSYQHKQRIRDTPEPL